MSAVAANGAECRRFGGCRANGAFSPPRDDPSPFARNAVVAVSGRPCRLSARILHEIGHSSFIDRCAILAFQVSGRPA